MIHSVYWKSIVLLASLVSVAKANIVISGSGPFGTLSDAEVFVPADPGLQPIYLTAISKYSQSFDVTVTGAPAGDPGWLWFWVDESGYELLNPPGFEELSSGSQLSGALSVSNPSPSPTIGSEPTMCDDSQGAGPNGRCYAAFTFGVPQEMTFTSVSQVAYSFFPSIQNLPPSASGRRLGTSVTIEPVLEVEDLSTHSFLRDGAVTFTPVDPPDPPAAPEPGTAALVVSGAVLVLLSYGTRMVRTAPAAPPTTTR